MGVSLSASSRRSRTFSHSSDRTGRMRTSMRPSSDTDRSRRIAFSAGSVACPRAPRGTAGGLAGRWVRAVAVAGLVVQVLFLAAAKILFPLFEHSLVLGVLAPELVEKLRVVIRTERPGRSAHGWAAGATGLRTFGGGSAGPAREEPGDSAHERCDDDQDDPRELGQMPCLVLGGLDAVDEGEDLEPDQQQDGQIPHRTPLHTYWSRLCDPRPASATNAYSPRGPFSSVGHSRRTALREGSPARPPAVDADAERANGARLLYGSSPGSSADQRARRVARVRARSVSCDCDRRASRRSSSLCSLARSRVIIPVPPSWFAGRWILGRPAALTCNS